MGEMFTTFLLLLLLLNQSGAQKKPVCKFDYDEALLEKMIRTEFKFEQLQADYSGLRGEVKATLDRMESTLDDIKDTRKDMKEEFAKLTDTTVANVRDFMNVSMGVFDKHDTQLSHMSEELQKAYNNLYANLTDSLSTPIISFKASGVTNHSPAIGEVLVFPNIMLNAGNGYDSAKGIFTAPADGLYLFTTQTCSRSPGHFTASIMVEGTEVGRSLSMDYNCGTGDAVAVVKEGQKVFVRTTHIANSLYSNEHRLMSFSGAHLDKGN